MPQLNERAPELEIEVWAKGNDLTIEGARGTLDAISYGHYCYI